MPMNNDSYWVHGGLAGLIIGSALWLKKQFQHHVHELILRFNGHKIVYEEKDDDHNHDTN
jgi:hypothetical protein